MSENLIYLIALPILSIILAVVVYYGIGQTKSLYKDQISSTKSYDESLETPKQLASHR